MASRGKGEWSRVMSREKGEWSPCDIQTLAQGVNDESNLRLLFERVLRICASPQAQGTKVRGLSPACPCPCLYITLISRP